MYISIIICSDIQQIFFIYVVNFYHKKTYTFAQRRIRSVIYIYILHKNYICILYKIYLTLPIRRQKNTENYQSFQSNIERCGNALSTQHKNLYKRGRERIQISSIGHGVVDVNPHNTMVPGSRARQSTESDTLTRQTVWIENT